MRWTKQEEKKVVELLQTGNNSFKDIAEILGRTKKSVKEKLRNLGYKESDYFIEDKYENVLCVNCDTIFTSLISEERKFCCSSCSTSHNNKKRGSKNPTPNETYNKKKRDQYHNRKTKTCLSCSNIVYNKYCSPSCQQNHKKKLVFELIEKGDISLEVRHYRKYLINKHGEKCMGCGWCEVNPHSGNVPIELEHIDGNSENNHLNNLKLLCPNCHSLTPTYKGLNAGNGRHNRRKRYKEGKSY